MGWIGRRWLRSTLHVAAASLACLVAPVSVHAAAWVKSVEYVEITLGPAVTQNFTNLTKGQNALNCVPFASETYSGATNSKNYEQAFTDVFVQNSPANVYAYRDNSTGTVVVGVFVVEFDPAYVRVQQGTFTYANGNGNGTPTLVPITSVNLAKAALVFYHRHDSYSFYGDLPIAGFFSAVNELTFRRYLGNGTANGHWFVFEALNSEFSVQTLNFSMANAVTGPTTSPALGTSVNTANTFVIASHNTHSTNDDNDNGQIAVWLSDSTHVAARRQWANSPPPNDSIDEIRVFVVTSSSIAVQRGLMSYTSPALTQTATIASVNTGTSMVWNGSEVGSGTIESQAGGATDADTGFQKLKLTNATTVQGDRAEGCASGCLGIGAFEVVDWNLATTAVTLTSFTAQGADSAVDLSWETGSELTNLGFHLYRATSADGPYERITASLVPGLGTSPVGASYSYCDLGLTNGTTYFYKLEDVDSTGLATLHGPVSATPQAGIVLAPPKDSVPGGASTSTRITYGDPTQVSLRVLERGPDSALLELTTGGFFAEPRGDGTVHLSVPGFQTLEQTGYPTLPVERTMLQALVGRRVRIASALPSDVRAFSSLRPEVAGTPEMSVLRNGTVQARRRKAARALWRGAWPEAAARVVSVAFQGETKKALVELAPLRWDEDTGNLLLARRLLVRVVFFGREEQEVGQGAHGRRPPKRARSLQGVVARLVTRQPGLHAVAFEQLFRAGRRPVASPELRLTRLGQAVSFFVSPDPQRFAPGSTLHFVSAGPDANPYGNEAVYELSLGLPGALMGVVSAAPSGATLGEAIVERDFEINRYYTSGLVEAPDLWLWDYLRSGDRKGFSFTLAQLAPSAGPAQVTIELQGASDYPVALDHHLRAFLNGMFVGETSWGGKRPQSLSADVPSGILREGANLLELESVNDTGAYSLVYLDRFHLRYPHALVAEAGVLAVGFERSGSANVAGLGAGTILLDTTTTPLRWLAGEVTSSAGVCWRVEGGHRYLAVSPEAVARPEVKLASRSSLRNTSTQADYLILTPRSFLGEAEPLLQQRRAQGLSARAVAIEEVFDEFGYGEARPEAIHDFLAYAFHNWRTPSVRYVLLLGDATYDPKSYTGYDSRNAVPAPIIPTTFMWTASDPTLAAVNGEDALPDLALGRLSASNLPEAHALVQKVLAWENAGFRLEGSAALVADNPDAAGDFEADAEEIAQTLLAARPTERIFLSRLGTDGTRSAIRAAFDRGVSLMSYIGHGSTMLWASENVFDTRDVPTLAPQAEQPLVLAMNCLNGFFHLPSQNTLGEQMVKAEDKGAIAAFTASGLSLDGPAHVYHKAVLREIVSGRHKRLGDAILAAQAAYADSGAFPELIAIYNLLGDPALEIQ